MRSVIRIIRNDDLKSFLDNRRNDGLILSALNLFMLGHLRKFKNFPTEAFFWCDGIFGVLFTRIKGCRISKTRGKVLTTLLIEYWQGSNVSVLGAMSEGGRFVLDSAGIDITEHIPLPAFDFSKLPNININVTCKVCIITLPSPKQELLASHLATMYPNHHFYCIGGALSMLADPKLNCPEWMHRLGLEFLFRLRSDTTRRLIRLFGSVINAVLNVGYLASCRLTVFRDPSCPP
jgi:hypothetical protein